MNETNRRHVINGAGDSRLIVREFSDDMMALMDAADLVVCMGGYNTTCELLTLRKRAVMVPRARPVEEQWIRAERLAAMGLFHAIHPDHLQPSMLMQAVKDELAKIDSGVPAPSAAIDLRGLSRMFEADHRADGRPGLAVGLVPASRAGARMSARGRLGVLVRRFPKLSETFILGEILGLERAGFEVTVFTLQIAHRRDRAAPGRREVRAPIVHRSTRLTRPRRAATRGR